MKKTKLWQQVKNPVGAPRKFKSPKVLWDECVKYFEWVEAHPIPENKVFAYEGAGFDHQTNRMRAMTLGGMYVFLGITGEGWRGYKERPEFTGVCTMVEEIIREQKFTGAAAGVLNPSIIARDLGLADNVNNNLSNPDGTLRPTIDVSKLSAQVLEELLNARDAAINQ